MEMIAAARAYAYGPEPDASRVRRRVLLLARDAVNVAQRASDRAPPVGTPSGAAAMRTLTDRMHAADRGLHRVVTACLLWLWIGLDRRAGRVGWPVAGG